MLPRPLLDLEQADFGAYLDRNFTPVNNHLVSDHLGLAGQYRKEREQSENFSHQKS